MFNINASHCHDNENAWRCQVCNWSLEIILSKLGAPVSNVPFVFQNQLQLRKQWTFRGQMFSACCALVELINFIAFHKTSKSARKSQQTKAKTDSAVQTTNSLTRLHIGFNLNVYKQNQQWDNKFNIRTGCSLAIGLIRTEDLTRFRIVLIPNRNNPTNDFLLGLDLVWPAFHCVEFCQRKTTLSNDPVAIISTHDFCDDRKGNPDMNLLLCYLRTHSQTQRRIWSVLVFVCDAFCLFLFINAFGCVLARALGV